MFINETINGEAPALIFAILFLSFIVYLIILVKSEKTEYNKMQKAKEMIEEGHKKAINGSKHDGFYRETKRLKEAEECKKQIKESVEQDIHLLS